MNSAAAPAPGSGVFVRTRPTVLCLAGVDPSAGAGLARDCVVADRLEVHPLPVPTALTVQNTEGVTEIFPVPGLQVRRMAEAVLADFQVGAAKVGMVATEDVVAGVAQILGDEGCFPVVIDPILRSGSGDQLLTRGGVRALKDQLIPRATVLTPNLAEAASLSGVSIRGMAELKEAAAQLCAMGAAWVLVKSHGLPGGAADLLSDGDNCWVLEGSPLDSDKVHGTGCTVSTAIACFLAMRFPVLEAVRRAKLFAEEAIRSAERLGKGLLLPGFSLKDLSSAGGEQS